MKILHTEVQKSVIQKPTKFEVLREVNKRDGLHGFPKLAGEYERLNKGYEGEAMFIHFLKAYGANHWVILRNIWFEYFGEFEIDVLLITRAGIYGFEVKNYTGVLELQNNQCKRNGEVIGHDPFSQAQRIAANSSGIFKRLSNQWKIQTVLTFIGENNKLKVHDSVDGIEVISRNELYFFTQQIMKEESNHMSHPLEIQSVLSALSGYEISGPSKEKKISNEVKENIYRGIICCNCGNQHLNTRKSYMICSCGMHEPREEAILRTICEYGVIYSDRDLKTTDLFHFFGGEISRKTISRYLNKFFKRKGTGAGTKYENLSVPIENVHDYFKLSQPKYLRLS
ncbi:MAG TPA: nuclease-related domain-containing protein [Atopostipes sp.]|nr:nuclease-related domain-containing protein [Atopostipes sp.]